MVRTFRPLRTFRTFRTASPLTRPVPAVPILRRKGRAAQCQKLQPALLQNGTLRGKPLFGLLRSGQFPPQGRLLRLCRARRHQCLHQRIHPGKPLFMPCHTTALRTAGKQDQQIFQSLPKIFHPGLKGRSLAMQGIQRVQLRHAAGYGLQRSLRRSWAQGFRKPPPGQPSAPFPLHIRTRRSSSPAAFPGLFQRLLPACQQGATFPQGLFRTGPLLFRFARCLGRIQHPHRLPQHVRIRHAVPGTFQPHVRQQGPGHGNVSPHGLMQPRQLFRLHVQRVQPCAYPLHPVKNRKRRLRRGGCGQRKLAGTHSPCLTGKVALVAGSIHGTRRGLCLFLRADRLCLRLRYGPLHLLARMHLIPQQINLYLGPLQCGVIGHIVIRYVIRNA